jgi:LacI family transcriptional regulator
VRVGGFQAETARSAARELLAAENRPTAIFAANDVSAIETITVAGGLGLGVPGDLSVVGFDNVPESALCEPPLTTVEQSIQQMGYEAVRMLIDLIDNPSNPPEQVVLPTRLIERSSCQPLAT